jgi:hypothetical protein
MNFGLNCLILLQEWKNMVKLKDYEDAQTIGDQGNRAQSSFEEHLFSIL